MKRFEILILSEMVNVGLNVVSEYDSEACEISILKYIVLTSTIHDLVLREKLFPKKHDNLKKFLTLFFELVNLKSKSIYYSFLSLDFLLRSKKIMITDNGICLLERNFEDLLGIKDSKFISQSIAELRKVSDSFIVEEAL